MKKIISILIICILLLAGCTNNSKTSNDKSKESDIKMSNIKVTIDDKTYNLNLENNNTVEEFINLLPQEYNINDLNGMKNMLIWIILYQQIHIILNTLKKEM